MPFYKKFGWTIAGVVLTPLLLFIAVALSGEETGKGTNIVALEVFPFGVLTNLKNVPGWLVYLQLPFYGLILDLSKNKKIAAFIILATHIAAFVIAFKATA